MHYQEADYTQDQTGQNACTGRGGTYIVPSVVEQLWQSTAAGGGRYFSSGMQPLVGCSCSRRWPYTHARTGNTMVSAGVKEYMKLEGKCMCGRSG